MERTKGLTYVWYEVQRVLFCVLGRRCSILRAFLLVIVIVIITLTS